MPINVVLILETFVAFVIALTLHECGHAAVALLLGDSSPARDGRLALNPVRHMAPIGTLVAAVLSFFPTYAGIGWGKPMRLDSSRLRGGPDLGIMLVALAGPIVSALVGLGILLGIQFVPGYQRLNLYATSLGSPCSIFAGKFGQSLEQCLAPVQGAWVLRLEQFAILVGVTSLLLALVNLIPLYPLDGYQVVFALLPNNPAVTWRRWEPYMEATLLIIFFAIPVLLRFIGVFFDPATLFQGLALAIAARVAGPAIFLMNLL
ncbi:MAG TPA: site-2 protease family protein [Ktedonobacterales bacterium]|jgi:Zn-dependent protease|nr:site-2 protease family protein [Ktedonobacterales bacterium]